MNEGCSNKKPKLQTICFRDFAPITQYIYWNNHTGKVYDWAWNYIGMGEIKTTFYILNLIKEKLSQHWQT